MHIVVLLAQFTMASFFSRGSRNPLRLFGTACNVTGDGALAIIIARIFSRRRTPDDTCEGVAKP